MRSALTRSRARRWWWSVTIGTVVVGLAVAALAVSLHNGRTVDADPAGTDEPSEGFLAARLAPPLPGGAG
jgi:hypothetical protein